MENHEWFDELNPQFSSGDKHTPVSLQLQQVTEVFIKKNIRQVNPVPCELDFSNTIFLVTTIVRYKLEFPPLAGGGVNWYEHNG